MLSARLRQETGYANVIAMPTLKHGAAPVQENDCFGWGPDHFNIQGCPGKWVVLSTPSAPKKSLKAEQSVENTTVKYHLSNQQRSTKAKLAALYEH